MEKELILKLFKVPTMHYNPSTISKEISRTRVGTFKSLKNLERKGIVKGKIMGKATFYTLNLDDEYVRKTVELLLMEEARAKQRWMDELKELFVFVDIAILFGSIIKNENNARDVDILLIFDKNRNKKIDKWIERKNKFMLKKIHPLKQTKDDLVNNIEINDRVIISALKEGVVLQGAKELIKVIRHVSSKK